MIRVRRSNERGHFNHGWLDTYHTFAFGHYYDPQQVQFRALRVMNEDRVAPGQGFGMHGHRDMEIVTYVISGALDHRDSLGNGSVLKAGEFQRMTAGTGIRHSEFNPSQTEPLHLYQIWLLPEREGLTPGYEETNFADEERRGRLRLVASRDARDGSLTIHQDAELYLGALGVGEQVSHTLRPGRHAWVQVTRGGVELHGERLSAGDGAAVSGEEAVTVRGALEDAEVLVFDLA